MKVNVNGETKELNYIKNNCDLASEVIGNFDTFKTDEERHLIMESDDFDWWEEELEKLAEIDDILDDSLLSGDDFDQFLNETENNDLEMQTDLQLEWLNDYIKEKKINY